MPSADSDRWCITWELHLIFVNIQENIIYFSNYFYLKL